MEFRLVQIPFHSAEYRHHVIGYICCYLICVCDFCFRLTDCWQTGILELWNDSDNYIFRTRMKEGFLAITQANNCTTAI